MRVARKCIRVFEHSELFFKVEKWIQIHVGKYPSIFFPLYRFARGDSEQTVGPETEIVIEGYPRSANSFAVAAFRRAQNHRVRIADHLHVPAQIILAAKLEIPAIVLLRNPKDAVSSLVVRDPISIRQALEYYISFYETVADYREFYILATFEEVTRNYSSAIERVNHKFGTDFTPFRNTARKTERIFASIDKAYERSFSGASAREDAVSRPSLSREETKRKVSRELSKARFEKLVGRAENVYYRLLRSSETE